jgi:agarase
MDVLSGRPEKSIGLLSRNEAELMLLGLSPEPEAPPILEIAPAGGAVPAQIPAMQFMDGAVITNWLAACPIASRTGVDFSRVLGQAGEEGYADEAAGVLAKMSPLDGKYVVAESWPDFGPAIDLKAMAAGEDGKDALFCAVLHVDSPRLVRVCCGGIGEGVTVHFYINGTSISHGGFVRLAAGTYVLVMEANSGRVNYTWQWSERRVGPRFDEVGEADIAAVHAWRHAVWASTAKAARMDERRAVARVKIDPATVVGKEGFIRVGRSEAGVWWLLGADGTPFHYRAMCSVNNRGSFGGRRKGDPLLPHDQSAHWLRIIRQWGFNGLGSWTTREFFDRGLVFTENIETFYEGPYLQGGEYRHGIVPDVFDPRWADRVDRKCRRLCAPLAGSKLLLGYFIDNERGFMLTSRPDGIDGPVYNVGEVPEKRRVIVAAEPIQNPEKLGLLQLALSLDAAARAGAARAWEFIEGRYGRDLASLSAAWGVPLTSRLSINEMTINGERLVSEAYLRDEEEFVRLWVRRYFEVSVGAIRRHDPNHMVIGLRWAGVPEEVIVEEEAKWSDIISLNRYRADIVEAFDPIYRRVGKPIVMGEFEPDNDSFRFVRDAIEPPGGYGDDWQRQHLKAETAIDRVSAHPGIVGYTYYAWKNGVRHGEEMKAIQRANWRATMIRAEQERRPRGAKRRYAPLNGQVTVVVSGSRKGSMTLGFVVRDGQWESDVYGDGIRGRVTSFEEKRGRVKLTAELRMIEGMFRLEAGSGTVTMDLQRTAADELEGAAMGTAGGKAFAGPAMAYLRRPVTSTKV